MTRNVIHIDDHVLNAKNEFKVVNNYLLEIIFNKFGCALENFGEKRNHLLTDDAVFVTRRSFLIFFFLVFFIFLFILLPQALPPR